MKRLKYIAFTVLLASFSLQSCDLERYPLTDLSEDNFWTDDKNAELALTSLYRGSITNGWNIVFRTFGLIMVCCLWNI